MENNFY